MILNRTKEQRFKVQKTLEKRRDKYYYQTGEAIGFMVYANELRGGAQRWKEK